MPVAMTKSGEITDKINALANGNKLSEIEVRILRREIEQLKSKCADEYFMLSGMLCSLLNDYEGAKENHEKALRLSSDEIDLINYGLSLRRLGRHRESLPLMVRGHSLSPGSVESLMETLVGMVFAGDFSCFNSVLGSFVKANPEFDLDKLHPYHSVVTTRSHLETLGIPEEEYRRVLGMAEDVVVSHGCQVKGIGVTLGNFDAVQHLSIELTAGDSTSRQLFSMNEEIADLVSSCEDLTRWECIVVNVTRREMEDMVA